MTHSKRKDTDSWDPIKTFILICSVAHAGLFFSSFSSAAEVVHFIITINSIYIFEDFLITFFFFYILLPLQWPLAVLWGFFVFLLDCFPSYSFPAVVIT